MLTRQNAASDSKVKRPRAIVQRLHNIFMCMRCARFRKPKTLSFLSSLLVCCIFITFQTGASQPSFGWFISLT